MADGVADGVGGGRFYRKIHGVAKGWPWGGHGVAEFSVGVAMGWPTGWTSATPATPSTPKETSIVHSRPNLLFSQRNLVVCLYYIYFKCTQITRAEVMRLSWNNE